MADGSRRVGSRPPSGDREQPGQHSRRSLGHSERASPPASITTETEYRAISILRSGLVDAEMVLSDRRIIGAPVSVELVIVASSGVWVIDGKKRDGLSVRGVDATGAVRELSYGKGDIAAQLRKLSEYSGVVAALVRDPGVPIRPVMVVLPDRCTVGTRLRLLRRKAFTHGTVLVASPQGLLQRVHQPGPLTREQVLRVGHRLDESMPFS